LARHLHLRTPGIAVLKISISEAVGQMVALALDGQVSGRWVELLRWSCHEQLSKGERVTIDLKNVSFADRDGIALLQSLKNQGAEILNSNAFIAEQIKAAQR
jgi:ABC-type transporter Mla MlaB component